MGTQQGAIVAARSSGQHDHSNTTNVAFDCDPGKSSPRLVETCFHQIFMAPVGIEFFDNARPTTRLWGMGVNLPDSSMAFDMLLGRDCWLAPPHARNVRQICTKWRPVIGKPPLEYFDSDSDSEARAYMEDHTHSDDTCRQCHVVGDFTSFLVIPKLFMLTS